MNLLRLTISSRAIGLCPVLCQISGSMVLKRDLAESFQHHQRFLDKVSSPERADGR